MESSACSSRRCRRHSRSFCPRRSRWSIVTESAAPPTTTPANGASKALGRMVFLAIAVVCFVFLYYRLNGAAAREGLPLVDYMTRVFTNVRWLPWLLLMVVYSCFYLMIDTLVLTRTLSW